MSYSDVKDRVRPVTLCLRRKDYESEFEGVVTSLFVFDTFMFKTR